MTEKRMEQRRREDTAKVAISSSSPPQFPPQQEQFFREALHLMNRQQVPYAVSGAFALHEHTGIWRDTKDLDLFLPPSQMQPALRQFEEAGFETELRYPIWLGKAWQNGFFVDFITGMSNAVIQVDQSWIDRSIRAEILGVPTRVLAAEELIASKIIVTRRERFDGADVAHVIYATRDTLDWNRVSQLVGDHWQMLLWSLIFFRYIYPRHANEIPRRVWHELLEKFERDLTDPKLDAPFRGTLIDENMFAIDVQEWGMENEIERYRAEHRSMHGNKNAESADTSAA
jgi:hypothetical protein